MRKVHFKKYIDIVYVNDEGKEFTPAEKIKLRLPLQVKEGTNRWSDDYPGAGYFNSWGVNSDEGNQYTVALVELEDGVVVEVLPSNLKFDV